MWLTDLLNAIFALFSGGETKVTLASPSHDPGPEPVGVGATIIKHYEGCQKKLPDGMIGPYRDAKGVPTIGWGNTSWEDGTPVKMTDAPITQARADALFDHWYRRFRDNVRTYLPSNTPPLHVEVFTSFAYNVGVPAFSTSTALKRYKAGDIVGAGEALEWFIYSGGKILKGLQRRRRAEHYIFDGMAPEQAFKQAEKDFP